MYRYRAATVEGQVVDGVVQASSQSTALDELRRQRLYPIDVVPVEEKHAATRVRSLGRGPALALFARTIATMLNAGATLERALAFAAAQARHPDVAEAARTVQQDLQAGASLADAIARHPKVFDAVFVSMVMAGEESGALDESMARVADHLDELVELRAQIQSSLLYPALMAVASGVGTMVLLFFVVPRFVAMLDDVNGALPLSTRILVGVSRVLVSSWWIVLLIAAAAALALRSWSEVPANRRRWQAWRLTWPLAGEIEMKYATARFTRTLGMVLRSGRPVLSSLGVARSAVSNEYLTERLDRAAEAVSHGKRLHVALAGTLPPLATELIAVGEESGRLDELCLRVAETYDHDVRRSLRALVAVIEPAMIIAFGVVVGFVALAMLQAIYAVNGSLP